MLVIEYFNYQTDKFSEKTFRAAFNEYMDSNKCYPKEEWPMIAREFISKIRKGECVNDLPKAYRLTK